MSVFPSETEILRLNGRVADFLAQPPGVRDVKMLRAILLGVRISRSADGPRADVFHRAAAMLHQVVSLRPFKAANGATALAAALLYLNRHGFGIAVGKGQAATLVKGVADGTLDATRIAAMFRLMVGKAPDRSPTPPPRAAAGTRS